MRLALSVLTLALAGCGDPSPIDVQAAACGRLEACSPEAFAETWPSLDACVDAYDESTSVCYDLHCTWIPSAGAACARDAEAQPCEDVANAVQLPSCEVEVLFRDCDDTALATCLAELDPVPS